MKVKVYKCFRILGWDFTITPTRFVLTGLVALMAATVLLRLLTGFQFVTNLTDETPWGMWIAFDVMCCLGRWWLFHSLACAYVPLQAV